jgi:two-component system OmpR family response regulator
MERQQDLDPKSILYIEDDVDTRDMVSFILGEAKYSVTACETYADGLRSAKRSRFALYIVDHTLPDGQGVDLCKEIRRQDSKTPIIFVSGYTDETHQAAARESGAHAFLSKPFSPHDLLELIRKIQD